MSTTMDTSVVDVHSEPALGNTTVHHRTGPIDAGLWALAWVARCHNAHVDPAAVRHEMGLGQRQAVPAELVRTAQGVGLRARALSGQAWERLQAAPRPLIIRLRDRGYVVLRRQKGGYALIVPEGGGPRPISAESLAQRWDGEMILLAREFDPLEVGERLDWSWLFNAVRRYYVPLSHVLLTSFFVQLFALVTPLFFQIIIDKVLVHHATDTLMLVATSLALIGIFDVLLQQLRTYTLAHTSSRIDVELGSQLMRKLLKLPLGYFEQKPTGQTVARVRELETIRTFLTGQSLTSIIDTLFTALFLIVLFVYSTPLALVVTAMIPIYVFVIFMVRPVLRRRVNERFLRSAESQQFLVENIVGAATIKAAAVEPLASKQWDERLALYVGAAFRTQMTGSIGQNIIQYLTKLSTVLILFFGAQEVIDGHLTVGGLVAFNMIAGQMTAPILRLANLWQDFQQVKVSVERLGDILSIPSENDGGEMSNLHPLKGDIHFENVSFAYQPGIPPVLRNISLRIAPGEVVGIVGASGSGKSTLAKLVQRLYSPTGGTIRVDGRPLEETHPAWLRRQIGVVLQENLLFNRSVHDNIALAVPDMLRADVVAMAELAGADEFIRRMPNGYDTRIEERGANLSGGQRQRIAIARALARNPRILIFDEATSALDYETEQLIQENMRRIVANRTVIVIAHRLATVRECDRIIALRDGCVAEQGTHKQLLDLDGIYAHLWSLQRIEA